ncbi:MAG TPA: septum formation initiator family protein [Bdellovibrionota bacterium]|nr:septum formation initiator family protein [Bdellovibrionota bacterium]
MANMAGKWSRILLRKLEIRFSRRRSLLWTTFLAYISALIFFSIVGDRGLWTSYQLWTRGKQIDREIGQFNRDIGRLAKKIELYRNDLRTIEREARQELQLAGENEIQYIFR